MKTSLLILSLFFTTYVNAQVPSVEKKWELEGLNNPESIVKDKKNNVLYVSNVNGEPGNKDNNGYIAKISVDGKIITQKWIEGLNAPKGMAIYKDRLYVADINDVVVIDISKGKIIKKYTAQGSTFLNDVTVDKNGNVFVSNTFGFSAIYKLNQKGKVELFLKDENLQMPNGLIIENNNLLVAPWGIGFDPATYKTNTAGSLLKVDLKTKSITSISKPIGNLDGLEKTIHGYLITDWLAGKLIYFKDNVATELVDLPSGSADLTFDADTKSIFIPLMNNNKIVTYQLKSK